MLTKLLILPTALIVSVSALTIKVGEPRQCETLEVEVTGGEPPYEITIVPQNIPGAQYTFLDTGSTYGWPVDIPYGTPFLIAARSNSTPWEEGIVSGALPILLHSRHEIPNGGKAFGRVDLLNVGGNSSSRSACLSSRSKDTDFLFNTNTSPFQHAQDNVRPCSNFTIHLTEDSPDMKPPLRFIGLPVQGTPFTLTLDAVPEDYLLNLTVPLKEGADFMVAAFDAGKWGNGGSTVPMKVKADDGSAFSGCTPQDITTTTAPTSTSFSSPSSSATLSASALAGIIAGAIILVLLLLLGAFLLLDRRRRNASSKGGAYAYSPTGPLDLDETSPLEGGEHIEPFTPPPASSSSPPATSYSSGSRLTSSGKGGYARSSWNSAGMYQAVPHSGALYPPSPFRRPEFEEDEPEYLQHTDAGPVRPRASRVVELPPAYPAEAGGGAQAEVEQLEESSPGGYTARAERRDN